MHKLFPLVCISLVTLLTACGSPDDGYYDTNGNWIANNPYNHSHPPLPGGTHDSRSDHTIYDDNRAVSSTTVTTTTYNYDQPGYYNSDGSYIGRSGNFAVPHRMFPPSGMCRVWFTDRTADDQPPIESCDDIRSRVPAGAYVIYGG